MSVNTILLDFSVASPEIGLKKEDEIFKLLSSYLPDLKKTFSSTMTDGGYLTVYTATRGTFVTVRGFPQGLMTFNIEYYKGDSEEQLLNFQRIRKLESELAGVLESLRSHTLPSLRRGGLERYFPSSDERILEYDIDAVVFEETSPYQKVQIVHSKSLGNLLILDGLQNLSERDLIYTETLMQRGKENYEGKEIVILGGGDGALLYELLKEKPKFVLMLELDDVVIQACRKHMKSCCGEVLDSMKGPNYEIVLGDCMIALNEMVKEGRKFDYVFGDLTDVPVSTTPQGEIWDFIRLILNTSMKILKPSGKYMTHCCGVACPSALKMFEEQMSNLDEKINFTSATAFVPSFLEDWVFYQIWRQNAAPN